MLGELTKLGGGLRAGSIKTYEVDCSGMVTELLGEKGWKLINHNSGEAKEEK